MTGRHHDTSGIGLYPGIPCLTLYQPWATATVIRLKRYETRSWVPPAKHIGRRIAIHAGQRLDLAWSPELEAALAQHAIARDYDFPLGAFLATAILAEVIPVETVVISTTERACGVYTPGRFAWRLGDVRPLPAPVPAPGNRQIWYWRAAEARRAVQADLFQATVA